MAPAWINNLGRLPNGFGKVLGFSLPKPSPLSALHMCANIITERLHLAIRYLFKKEGAPLKKDGGDVIVLPHLVSEMAGFEKRGGVGGSRLVPLRAARGLGGV